MTLSELEREVIVLRTTIEVINSMVNREMMNDPSGEVDAQMTFRSPTRRALFSILLADLLENVDVNLLNSSGSLMDALMLVVGPSPATAAKNELCATA